MPHRVFFNISLLKLVPQIPGQANLTAKLGSLALCWLPEISDAGLLPSAWIGDNQIVQLIAQPLKAKDILGTEDICSSLFSLEKFADLALWAKSPKFGPAFSESGLNLTRSPDTFH